MKTKFIVLVSLSFLIIGCSHTYVLNKESPLESIEKINDETNGKKGVIQTRDGRKHGAEEIHVSLDSTLWIDAKTNSFSTRPNSELYQIVVKNHGKGAVEGLGIGFLSGFTSGFTLGYLSSTESEFFGKQGTATISGTVLGLLGGFLV